MEKGEGRELDVVVLREPGDTDGARGSLERPGNEGKVVVEVPLRDDHSLRLYTLSGRPTEDGRGEADQRRNRR
jgi:hypothetical protein